MDSVSGWAVSGAFSFDFKFLQLHGYMWMHMYYKIYMCNDISHMPTECKWLWVAEVTLELTNVYTMCTLYMCFSGINSHLLCKRFVHRNVEGTMDMPRGWPNWWYGYYAQKPPLHCLASSMVTDPCYPCLNVTACKVWRWSLLLPRRQLLWWRKERTLSLAEQSGSAALLKKRTRVQQDHHSTPESKDTGKNGIAICKDFTHDYFDTTESSNCEFKDKISTKMDKSWYTNPAKIKVHARGGNLGTPHRREHGKCLGLYVSVISQHLLILLDGIQCTQWQLVQ